MTQNVIPTIVIVMMISVLR